MEEDAIVPQAYLNKPTMPHCFICEKNVHSDFMTNTSCGREYHDTCIRRWYNSGKKQCPGCPSTSECHVTCKIFYIFEPMSTPGHEPYCVYNRGRIPSTMNPRVCHACRCFAAFAWLSNSDECRRLFNIIHVESDEEYVYLYFKSYCICIKSSV